MIARRLIITIASAATLFVLAPLLGCAAPDRLSRDGFDRIRVHAATQEEVQELIGPPDSKLADMWLYHRPDDHVEVMLDFDDQGRVVRKQWIDGMSETWDDYYAPPPGS